jgi:hypothetical protein
MNNFKKNIPIILFVIFIFFFVINKINNSLSINYPFDKTLFPPEFPAPVFKWKSKSEFNGNWEIKLSCENGLFTFDTVLKKTNWTPTEIQWEKLKQLSDKKEVKFIIKRAGKIGKTNITFSFSTDSVAAPILFRQMPIPFVVAERQLDSMNYILFNVGSKKTPNIAMKGFQVCGNCHSFTQDGRTIGLDLDAGLRDKGGYFIASVSDTIIFDIKNYMSWTKIENRKTFGLFSKISPNGRYIVTTVKDRTIHKNFPFDPETIAFSQLFFPVNGHLAIYDRENKLLQELTGANFDEYVQSNAIWTPDGKNIIFCRAKALPYEQDSTEINITDDQLIEDYVQRKKSLKFELCIIPFNNGKGGVVKTIEGASNNGMSNYFPAISTDGKWIVYCQAKNFMLLQPDSRLFIVPAQGGKSKLLSCNLPLMNSWHAWSPNSKWIVFVSKGMSVYSDLFITHIDEEGNASPPVLLEKARQYRKVANYPEFLNVLVERHYLLHRYV